MAGAAPLALPFPFVSRRSTTHRSLDKEVANGQVIKGAVQESPNGVLRRAYDRLFVDVERGIDDDRYPGALLVFLNDLVIGRIVFPPNQLRAGGIVDM